MKKRMAVLMMFNARTWKILLLTIAAMAAANVVVYVKVSPMSKGLFPGRGEHLFMLIFLAGLLEYVSFTSMMDKNRYTHNEYLLKRLRISEKEIFLLKWMSASLSVTVLTLMDMICWYAIAVFNSTRPEYCNGPQGIVVQMLGSELFCSFLLFGNPLLIVKNVLMILMMGAISALMMISQMYNRKSWTCGVGVIFCAVQMSISRVQSLVIAGIIVNAIFMILAVIGAFNIINSADVRKPAEFRKELMEESA